MVSVRKVRGPWGAWAAMLVVVGCGGLNNSDSTTGGLTAGGSGASGSLSGGQGGGGRAASPVSEVPGAVAGYVFVKSDEATVGDPVVIRPSDEDLPGYERAKGGTLFLNVAPTPGAEATHQEKVSLDGNVLQETLDVHPNGVVTVSGTAKGAKGEEILKASAPIRLDASGTTLLSVGAPSAKSEPAGAAKSYRVVLDGKTLGDKPITLIAPAKSSDEAEDRYLSFLGVDEKSRAGAALTITPPTTSSVTVTRVGEGLYRLHAKSAAKDPVDLEFKVASGKDGLKSTSFTAKITVAAHAEFLGKRVMVPVGTSGAASADLTVLITDASGRPLPSKSVTFSAPDLSENRWSSSDDDLVFAGGPTDAPNIIKTDEDGKARITVRGPKNTDGMLMGSTRKLTVRVAVEGGGRASTSVDIVRR